MLANESQRLREKSAKQANGEETSDDEEEDDIEEELGYISPLDIVDPYITFKQALTSTCSAGISRLSVALTPLFSVPNEEWQRVPNRDDVADSRAPDFPHGGNAPRGRACCRCRRCCRPFCLDAGNDIFFCSPLER